MLVIRAAPEMVDWFSDDPPAPNFRTPSSIDRNQFTLPQTPEGTSSTTTAAEPSRAPPEDASTERRHFSWSYGGYDWTWDLSLPQTLYDYYGQRDFLYDGPNHAYDVYVLTTVDDPYLMSIADELTRLADNQGWNDYDRVGLALAFVQSLDYTPDDVTTGYDEFPKYPIETLWDHGGDCEDSSILFASIVQQMGFGAVMFGIFDHPNPHMAVGVAADNSKGRYGGIEYDNRFYAYAETTGSGFDLGTVPDAYKGVTPKVFHLQDRTFFGINDWSVEDEGISAKVVWSAINYGSLAGSGYELTAYMMDGERVTDRWTCTLPRVEPEMGYRCEANLKWPSYGTAEVRFYVVKDNVAVASASSDE